MRAADGMYWQFGKVGAESGGARREHGLITNASVARKNYEDGWLRSLTGTDFLMTSCKNSNHNRISETSRQKHPSGELNNSPGPGIISKTAGCAPLRAQPL